MPHNEGNAGMPELSMNTSVGRAQAAVLDDQAAKIKKAKTINAVTDLMLHADTQKTLADLPEGIRDEIRDFAKARLVELGWPTKKAA